MILERTLHDNMDRMKKAGITVFVDIPMQEIAERLKSDDTRPLMKTHDLNELANARRNWYEQAHHRVTNYNSLLNLFTKK